MRKIVFLLCLLFPLSSQGKSKNNDIISITVIVGTYWYNELVVALYPHNFEYYRMGIDTVSITDKNQLQKLVKAFNHKKICKEGKVLMDIEGKIVFYKSNGEEILYYYNSGWLFPFPPDCYYHNGYYRFSKGYDIFSHKCYYFPLKLRRLINQIFKDRGKKQPLP